MRYLTVAIYTAVSVLACLPVLNHNFGDFLPWLSENMVAALNLLAWTVVISFIISRRDLYRSVEKVARTLGVDTRLKSLDWLFSTVLREVERKNRSLSVSLAEQRISSKEELSKTLEKIVSLAYRIFEAESAELALYDKDSGLYHSAFVVGTPMGSGSQAMLAGVSEQEPALERPDILVQPLAFAGSVLGTLRVMLKNGVPPSLVDQEIMRLLAMQGSLALINAQYTSELMKMRRASEESFRAKTGFLANLSHEVRAPLGIMMNAVELVLDGLCGPVSQDQLDTLKMVRSNGEHLLELINDVLDYAKVEAGRMLPQKSDIVVGDLLQDVCNVVRPQVESKSHTLSLKPSELPLAISCDRRHIRQMIINLLTNAIKYTPDGGTIEVWAERAPGNKVKIHVKDSGVGIKESEREKVFAPFERLDNLYSLNQVGSGLGMSLTQKLAEVNGGGIDFSSIAGQGSDFWLAFPSVEPMLARAEAVPETNAAPAKGRGEVVMLVERDEGERTMMARYLAHNGFLVASASSTLEALEVFKTRKIDLAIIDNNVVDNPSDDIIKAVREMPNGQTLPIVLVSSRAFVFDIEHYLKTGIDRCLIKPVKLSELGHICRQLLDGEFTGAVIDEHELSEAPKAQEKPSTAKGKAETKIIEAIERER
ncbi:MAG: response regulator [Deltaproteobacteria bacterium]|nr:response regulator [Deltaproteobacteria bacterium]